ncbi:hypothetical protein [Paraburkholderia sediminicola]|uniref:hypothetical protein n=1 Tax=Paraburkholderia sediminicola TaxID=458836 RepID=UPI0038BD6991
MQTQDINPFTLTPLFRKELAMCKVTAGTKIVLITDLKTSRNYVDASFAAAEELGASIYEVRIAEPFNSHMIASQGGGDTISALPEIVAAVEAADLVLVFHVALGSHWLQNGRKKGTRFLLIIDGPDELKRLISPPGLKEAVIYAGKLAEQSRVMRVTSPAGTDFTAQLGKLGTVIQYGYADEPGVVDTWGGAHFSTWPNPDGSEGVIVLQPGDYWILPYVRTFESTVKLTIERGFIRKIEGTGADRRIMERFFEGHKKHSEDLDPYAVSHLGWGLNPNSILDQVTLTGNQMDRIASHTRAWPGVFLFSTGPNDQGGGSNRTPAHLDLPMFDCTVAFDDKTVIKDGVIVDPQMVVAQTEERRIAG